MTNTGTRVTSAEYMGLVRTLVSPIRLFISTIRLFIAFAFRHPRIATFMLILAACLSIPLGLVGYQYLQELKKLRVKFAGEHQSLALVVSGLNGDLNRLRDSNENQEISWELLGQAATGDYSGDYQTFEQHRRNIRIQFEEVLEISNTLDRLRTAESTFWIDTLQEALNALHDARLQLKKGQMSKSRLERDSGKLGRRLAALLERESDLLYRWLREFSDSLHGYLNQIRDSKPKTPQERTAHLASLAGIFYIEESIEGKSKRLSLKTTNVENTIDRLSRKTHPDDKTLVREKRRQDPGAEFKRLEDFTGQWEVIAWALNVRSQPSTDSPVLFTLDRGQRVEVLSQPGYWWQIKTGQGTGWVGSKHLAPSQ